MNTIKYTSNSNNKWGLVSQGDTIKYVEKKTHNGLVLFMFLVPAAAIVGFIITHI